jgi:hypothetical protein
MTPLKGHIQRAKIEAVVQAIGQRAGSSLPSAEVRRKAAERLQESHRFSQAVHHATLYHVEGDVERYMVVLLTQGDGCVIDGECSCGASSVCWHLLDVLTMHTDGNPNLILT